MSARLDAELEAELAAWQARGLRRELGPGEERGAPSREFASNDYLSLARDARVVEAAREALARFGAGGRAARLLGGGCPLDGAAEEAAAEWLRAEAALLFPTGYHANLGVIGALARRGDAVVSDERNHASLIDGASLSRARVLVHRHLDLDDVERALRSARGARRRIVVTESVFSMDGDAACLPELHELCKRYDASLVVDEAHSIGLLGPEGAGAWAAIDPAGEIACSGRLAARIVTGGKALGASGAFVVGSRVLREVLVQRARSFVFTTASSPAAAGALVAAIGIARGADREREKVLELARALARELRLPVPSAAIVPFVVGSSADALALAARLGRAGFDVRAVRPPTVAEGSARLRIVCHAHNDRSDVVELARELRASLATERTTRDAEPTVLSGVRHASASTGATRSDVSTVAVEARAATTLFVVGTGTDVGKTVVAALLVRAAARAGQASYWKPVQTGTESDTAEVRRLTGDATSVRWFDPLHELALPASPHEAAHAQGVTIELARIEARLAEIRRSVGAGTVVVELAGGLLVPYDDEVTQADWLAREAPTLVLVARSGLGTLNHTLLALEALAARRLVPRALFLVGSRHPSNARTLAQRGGIASVIEVEPFEPLDARALERWLDSHDLAFLFPREDPAASACGTTGVEPVDPERGTRGWGDPGHELHADTSDSARHDGPGKVKDSVEHRRDVDVRHERARP